MVGKNHKTIFFVFVLILSSALGALWFINGMKRETRPNSDGLSAIFNSLPDTPLALWRVALADDDKRLYALEKMTVVHASDDQKVELPGFVDFCRRAEKENDFKVIVTLVGRVSRIISFSPDISAYFHTLVSHKNKIIAYLALLRLTEDNPAVMEEYMGDLTYEKIPSSIRTLFSKNETIIRLRNACFVREIAKYLKWASARQNHEQYDSIELISDMLQHSSRPYEHDYYNIDDPSIFKLYDVGMECLGKLGIDPLVSALPDLIALSFMRGGKEIGLVLQRYINNPNDHNRMTLVLAWHNDNLSQIEIPDNQDRFTFISTVFTPEWPDSTIYVSLENIQGWYDRQAGEINRRYREIVTRNMGLYRDGEESTEKIDINEQDLSPEIIQRYFPIRIQ